MVESLLRIISLLHLFLYEALEELSCLSRVSCEGLMIEVEVALYDISDDFKLRVAWERHLS